MTGGQEDSGRVPDPPVFEEPALPAQDGPASPRVAAPDPHPGDMVGPYRLHAVLGKGGAGTVFRATHGDTGEVVALKVLAASKVKRARVVQRFFDEVRAASLVDHPGLVRIFDFIEEDTPRRLAYAMEYVDGESLRQVIRRDGALDLRTAIAIAQQICDSLAALHQAGIIHRDLKPENILLVHQGDRLSVKLLDFGVVKFLPVDRSVPGPEPASGTFVGTPRYMAPEQAAGAAVDHRADLFALGVMLFEMITGHCPHEGDSLRDVVLAKLKGAPRITVNPEQEILPQELTDVVDACLQLKPNLRPSSALEVAGVLVDAELILFAVGRPVRATESNALSDMRAPMSSPAMLATDASTPGETSSFASPARAPTSAERPSVGAPASPPPIDLSASPSPIARSTLPAQMASSSLPPPIDLSASPSPSASRPPVGSSGSSATPRRRAEGHPLASPASTTAKDEGASSGGPASSSAGAGAGGAASTGPAVPPAVADAVAAAPGVTASVAAASVAAASAAADRPATGVEGSTRGRSRAPRAHSRVLAILLVIAVAIALAVGARALVDEGSVLVLPEPSSPPSTEP